MQAPGLPGKTALQLLQNSYQIFIGFKKDKEKNEIQACWTIQAEKITGFCNPEEYMVQSIYKNKWR